MGSLLRKAARGGMDALSKGLYRRYESTLKQEEEEANFLREQNLAQFKNNLDVDRLTKMKNLDKDIEAGQAGSGYVLGDRVVSMAEYNQMDEEARKGLTSVSDRTMAATREKATFDNETVRQINNANIAADAGELYDAYAGNSEEFAALVDREKFIKDMKLMAVASKGEKPLSNAEMIDLYKIQTEAWSTMATDNPDEMQKRIGDAGGDPAKAFNNYLLEGRKSVKGGKTGRDKVKGAVKAATKEKTIQHLRTIPQDQAVQEIMDKHKVGKVEAIELFEEVTGDSFVGDKEEKPGAPAGPKEYGPAHAGRGLLRDLGVNVTKPLKGKAFIDALDQ